MQWLMFNLNFLWFGLSRKFYAKVHWENYIWYKMQEMLQQNKTFKIRARSSYIQIQTAVHGWIFHIFEIFEGVAQTYMRGSHFLSNQVKHFSSSLTNWNPFPLWKNFCVCVYIKLSLESKVQAYGISNCLKGLKLFIGAYKCFNTIWTGLFANSIYSPGCENLPLSIQQTEVPPKSIETVPNPIW